MLIDVWLSQIWDSFLYYLATGDTITTEITYHYWFSWRTCFCFHSLSFLAIFLLVNIFNGTHNINPKNHVSYEDIEYVELQNYFLLNVYEWECLGKKIEDPLVEHIM